MPAGSLRRNGSVFERSLDTELWLVVLWVEADLMERFATEGSEHSASGRGYPAEELDGASQFCPMAPRQQTVSCQELWEKSCSHISGDPQNLVQGGPCSVLVQLAGGISSSRRLLGPSLALLTQECWMPVLYFSRASCKAVT